MNGLSSSRKVRGPITERLDQPRMQTVHHRRPIGVPWKTVPTGEGFLDFEYSRRLNVAPLHQSD